MTKKIVYRVKNISKQYLLLGDYKTRANANKKAKATQKRVNAIRKVRGERPFKFKAVRHLKYS